MRLGVSPAVSTPQVFFQSEVPGLYFPVLEPWVVWSGSLPSCSSWFIHSQMCDHPIPPAAALPASVLQPPCCESSPSWLPTSFPPTDLDECFFSNSLVVGLPYSTISGSSGHFLFINLLCSFFGCARRQSISTYTSIMARSIFPHSCFIHSSTDGHLGCFHILAIINKAAMNIGVFMLFRISVLGSFGYIPRSGIARSKTKICF